MAITKKLEAPFGVARHISAIEAWFPGLVSIAITCLTFGLVFQREIAGAVRVWSDSTAYNHCFLVLPLSALLLWLRRDVILVSQPSPTVRPLIFLPWLCLLWILSALMDVLEAEQLLVVALFEVLLIAILGWRVFRRLMAPLLFFFFLVPFGAFLVPALQRFTAAFAVFGLNVFQIPVFADGLIIEIPEGSFAVAEACAGLRFLIASIVFGCFFATIVYRTWLRRIIFVVLSLCIPVIANGVRALGLILLAHARGSAAAVMADHVIYGWLFFTLVIFIMILVGMAFVEPKQTTPPPVQATPFLKRNRPLHFGTVIAVGLFIVVLGPGWLVSVENASSAPLGTTAISLAPRSPWVKTPRNPTEWFLALEGLNDVSKTEFGNGDMSATELVVLYRLPARGSLLSRLTNAIRDPKLWDLTATGTTRVLLGDKEIKVNTATVKRQASSQTMWWFYLIDGQVTASVFEAKLLQARAALSGGEHTGAFVALLADGEDPISNPTLARFAEAMALR